MSPKGYNFLKNAAAPTQVAFGQLVGEVAFSKILDAIGVYLFEDSLAFKLDLN